MKVYQLFTTKSIGISNYTKDLANGLSESINVDLINVGGSYILNRLEPDQLLEHLVSSIDKLHGVLHIQHDHTLFRGAGDDWDELETTSKFLEQATKQFEKVVITIHGHTDYTAISGSFVEKLMQRQLLKYYKKKIVPKLNKCTLLVHSDAHLRTLQRVGVKHAFVFVNPTERKHTAKPLKTDQPIKFVIPGGLNSRGYKNVNHALEVVSKVSNSELYVDASDPGVYINLLNRATALGVNIKQVTWPIDSEDYIEQLSKYDIGLMLFDSDVPLSGSLVDSLRAGLIAITSVTPSFAEFNLKYNCTYCMNSADSIAEWVDQQRDVNAVDWNVYARNVDNYFNISQSGWKFLLNIYDPTRVTTGTVGNNRSTTVAGESSIESILPRHMPNIAKQLAYCEIDCLCAEQLTCRTTDKSILLHGPYDRNITTGNKHVTSDIIDDIDQSAIIYCTNSTLRDLVMTHGYETKLLKIQTTIDESQILNPGQYDKHLQDVGWWCRDNGSIYDVCVPEGWKKSKVFRYNEPALELAEFTNKYNNTVKHTLDLSTDSVIYIDQITDDVVDDVMIGCISTGRPMLIRRNNTTEEYLGSYYPLMFDDIKQAGELLTDENITKAAQQLKQVII